MILVDANILLYATFSDSDPHVAARDWLTDRFNGTARIGLPWSVLLAFLRISTNRAAFQNPLTADEACGQVEEWLALPCVWIPTPGERHAMILTDLLRRTRAQGNLVADAHLAALAIEHGLELCSADGDFARFPGLRWDNPLAPRSR